VGKSSKSTASGTLMSARQLVFNVTAVRSIYINWVGFSGFFWIWKCEILVEKIFDVVKV
jgi:hypothetical protein